MASLWFVIALASGVLWVVVGFHAGRKWRELEDSLHDVLTKIGKIEEELSEEPESAVVETTPQLIDKKRRQGKLEENDSAIINAKSPRDIEKKNEETMAEFIQRIS